VFAVLLMSNVDSGAEIHNHVLLGLLKVALDFLLRWTS